ncbi:hypothetical protein F5Y06DRAFT_157293 [Hypoxylon sp. FL0890]|nr:hypothetical protein F5Y06DRAFT_157293 [Hypoxylon sp. FL0890]
MMFANSLLALASVISLAFASPLQHAHRATNHTGLPLPAKVIFQFNQTGTWFENLAVRPNGDLVLTSLTPTASVWTLKRPYTPHPEFALLHTFMETPGLVGIAETKPDTFVMLAAEFVGSADPVPGSYSIWELSLRGTSPATRKISNLTEVQLGNGVASVPSCKGDVVLIGDSFAGSLWRLNTTSGAHESVMAVAQMAAPAGAALPIGINGLKVHDGYVYWSNSATVTIYRSKIDKNGYPVANATIETIATLDSPFVDDFAFDEQGLIWAATNSDNKVDVVRPNGSYETVVGGANEDIVGGDTAVAFGRTLQDRNILYVTTSGTLPNNRTEPAKIVAVNRAGFH